MKLEKIFVPVIHLWFNYKAFVRDATIGNSGIKTESINFWREKLFTNFITYLLPFCLFAIIPGVWISITENYYLLAGFYILATAFTTFVALNRRWNLPLRKAFVFLMIYALSIMLMLYLGMFGLGMIYLLALSVLVTLLLPKKLAYWSIALNLLVCICCVILYRMGLLQARIARPYHLGVWIAIVSNLIFLCLVVTALINKTIAHLESAIAKKFQLKYRLQQEAAKGIRRDVQIKESEEHYKSLFFFSPLPMWVLDPKTLMFLQVNESACREYGYSPEEFLNMNISEIKFEEDMSTLEKDIQKSLRAGTPLKLITRHRRKNHEVFHVEVCFNIIMFQGKQASLVILRDITQEVNYLHAIECQNKQLRDIAWTQSHSVRKPLASIISLTTLIRENPGQLPDIKLLDYLTTSAYELDQCIRNISQNAKGL